jgi:hypothetical protein
MPITVSTTTSTTAITCWMKLGIAAVDITTSIDITTTAAAADATRILFFFPHGWIRSKTAASDDAL